MRKFNQCHCASALTGAGRLVFALAIVVVLQALA